MIFLTWRWTGLKNIIQPCNQSFMTTTASLRKFLLPLVLSVWLFFPADAATPQRDSNACAVQFNPVLIGGIPTEIIIESLIAGSDTVWCSFYSGNQTIQIPLLNGRGIQKVIPEPHQRVKISINQQVFESENRAIPLWFSIIPPLIAILFALIFKEVFTALILGLLSGTFMIAWYGGAGVFASLGLGLLRIIDTYVITTLANPDHVSIIVFSFLIGGMVHIITQNGGMKGIVHVISKFASTRRSTLLSTWLLGLVIFFDDYANTLVVGNTMKPLADRMKISREKLSYVVDSTAAPVSAIAFITTWIGAELSYIKNAVDAINATHSQGIAESPYSVFLQSIGYSFYPILTLGFVFLLIWSRRDYGPMRKAEARSITRNTPTGPSDYPTDPGTGEIEPDPSLKPRALNALLPVVAVVAGTCIGLTLTGLEHASWDTGLGLSANLSNIIGQADSFRSLLWASFSGLFIAIILSVAQRLLTLQKAVDSMISGFKTMLTAMLILVLAWSLALVTKHLHTAEFLSDVILRLEITPHWIPVITFVLGALVSFSTGSSWGTMAILYPLLLPTAWNLFIDYQLPHPEAMMLFHIIIASVLAGAVFGDHCSPISDTTILSSLATGCNHVEHVRTQLPYALTVGGVSIVFGIIPVSFGLHPLAALILSLSAIWLFIRFVGKRGNS
jgi:Na+/H+ antiporter NhaC